MGNASDVRWWDAGISDTAPCAVEVCYRGCDAGKRRLSYARHLLNSFDSIRHSQCVSTAVGRTRRMVLASPVSERLYILHTRGLVMQHSLPDKVLKIVASGEKKDAA